MSRSSKNCATQKPSFKTSHITIFIDGSRIELRLFGSFQGKRKRFTNLRNFRIIRYRIFFVRHFSYRRTLSIIYTNQRFLGTFKYRGFGCRTNRRNGKNYLPRDRFSLQALCASSRDYDNR